MTINLLGCPFCGGEAEQRPVRDGTKTRCNRCSADVVAFNGPDDPGGRKRSAEQWNRRAEGAPAAEGASLPPLTGVTHDLKTWPEPFAAIRAGLKPWELRFDDRNYQVGDTLRLREWNYNFDGGVYTGEVEERAVVWKLEGGQFGLPKGYSILSLAALSPPAAGGKEEACGILPPRLDPLCVSASPCLLPDGHDGPHACETRDGRRSWQSDDDCDCCDVTDPDRCITWSPAPAAEPVISTDGPHEISTTRKWLARQLLDSMLSEKEALGVVAYSPALEGLRPPEPVAIIPEEIAAFLVEQQDEPDPFGDMGERGHYWRDKCITAGQRLDPKRWGRK